MAKTEMDYHLKRPVWAKIFKFVPRVFEKSILNGRRLLSLQELSLYVSLDVQRQLRKSTTSRKKLYLRYFERYETQTF